VVDPDCSELPILQEVVVNAFHSPHHEIQVFPPDCSDQSFARYAAEVQSTVVAGFVVCSSNAKSDGILSDASESGFPALQ
jgi:hypothetical protein